MPCLDTTVLVDLLRPRAKAEHRRAVEIYRSLLSGGEEVCTTRVCEAELRVGIYAGARSDERQRVEELLGTLIVLEIGSREADRFARIKAHLARIGRPAGDMDVLIASIASVAGQALITRNPAHFMGVPGLVVRTY